MLVMLRFATHSLLVIRSRRSLAYANTSRELSRCSTLSALGSMQAGALCDKNEAIRKMTYSRMASLSRASSFVSRPKQLECRCQCCIGMCHANTCELCKHVALATATVKLMKVIVQGSMWQAAYIIFENVKMPAVVVGRRFWASSEVNWSRVGSAERA